MRRLNDVDNTLTLLKVYDNKFPDDFSICKQCGKDEDVRFNNCGHTMCLECAKE